MYFSDHVPLFGDPDTWLDSDEDASYVPDSSFSSDSGEETTVIKKRRKRKHNQDTHRSTVGENARDQDEEDKEIDSRNDQVGEALPFKKRKKRDSLKGRSRDTRLLRKTNRNTGQQYTTESGKIVPEKKWSALGNCRRKCKDSVLEEDAKNLFKEYWNIGDYSKRASYISSLITTHEKMHSKIKVVEPEKQKNRFLTHEYHLRINGKLIQICKGCFMKVFAISAKFLEVICAKANSSLGGIVIEDCRGKHKPPNALSDEVIKFARDHIMSIPSYESHYSRRQTDKRYLPSHYTLSQMYKEYKEKIGNGKPVSRTIYEKLFRELNLSIHAPKNDTCNTCDKLAMQIRCSVGDAKNVLEAALQKHHQSADDAYKAKQNDKAAAKDEDKTTLTFDLQQCLPTPNLASSVIFYKRQLWTFNLTVHDSKDNQPYCYMWSETDGGRGSNQIASCVAKHMNTLPSQVKHVVLYSDTCGGQNKNSTMLGMFMSIVKNNSNLEIIDHKFLVPGHTHMECDADHAQIEKKKKKTKMQIFHPHDWMQLVRQTGEKRKFQVIEMGQQDFLQYSDLFEGNNKEKCRPLRMPMRKGKMIYDDNGDRFLWSQVRWLQFRKSSPLVFYKKSLDVDEPFKSLSVLKPGQSRNKLLPSMSYKNRIPITDQKKKDLLSMLYLIPPVFHEFYKNLPTSNKPETLPDVIDGDVEED